MTASLISFKNNDLNRFIVVTVTTASHGIHWRKSKLSWLQCLDFPMENLLLKVPTY